MKRRILLMIPCYNESRKITDLLNEISSLRAGYHTLVVDDGSNDDTFEKAEKLSACVRLPVNLGIGGAVQTAIKYAYANNYDLCVQVDGDGQHPPAEIKKLVAQYENTRNNLIVGSRFLRSGKGFKSTPLRRVGINSISFSLKFLFGRKITDPTSGLRLMDRRAMELFCNEYPVDYPEPISIAVALENKLKVGEVAVKMRSREHGKSSIFGLKSFLYMIRIIGYLFLVRLGRQM